VLALFAVWLLLGGRTVCAWLSITAALFFKPPVLVLVPLLLIYPLRFASSERRDRLVQTGWGIAAACAFAELLALTYFPNPNPLVAARQLLAQYAGASSVFGYTSLNAFNLWALTGPFFCARHGQAGRPLAAPLERTALRVRRGRDPLAVGDEPQ
jgi:hypothetical protein